MHIILFAFLTHFSYIIFNNIYSFHYNLEFGQHIYLSSFNAPCQMSFYKLTQWQHLPCRTLSKASSSFIRFSQLYSHLEALEHFTLQNEIMANHKIV